MIFLKACLFGGIIGVVYDLFRILRRSHSFQKRGIFFQDVLFFLLAAVMTLIFVVAIAQGQLRGFILIFQAVGAWLYFNTLSPIVLKSTLFLLDLLKRMLLFCYRILLFPLFKVVKQLTHTFYRKWHKGVI